MKSLQKCTEKLSIRLAFTKWFQKLAFIDVISGLTTEKKEYSSTQVSIFIGGQLRSNCLKSFP